MNKNINIGVAGLGTVGQGVLKILTEKRELFKQRCDCEINIVAVSARDKNKDRGINLSRLKWYDNAVDLANDKNVDVVIELIGGAEGSAAELVRTALNNGKHVVTANKALIAKHGVALAKAAERNNVALMFEASVAGGIPVIKAIKEGLSANRIKKIMGILNGTCNFILTKMETEKREFSDVLKEAQKLGYAEADPSFDVDGIDAAHKLVILSSLAFGIKPDISKTYIEGITKVTLEDINYAGLLGYKIKLLAIANENEKGEIEQRVHPCVVDARKDIANINGVLGAVKLNCDSVGEILLTGAGAGMLPTASAVVADILDVANNKFVRPFVINADELKEGRFAGIENHESEYYLRFSVKDTDGVLSSLTSILSNNKVGFEKIHQELQKDRQAYIVMITHKVKEENIKKSLAEITRQDYVVKEPIFIRVEE